MNCLLDVWNYLCSWAETKIRIIHVVCGVFCLYFSILHLAVFRQTESVQRSGLCVVKTWCTPWWWYLLIRES